MFPQSTSVYLASDYIDILSREQVMQYTCRSRTPDIYNITLFVNRKPGYPTSLLAVYFHEDVIYLVTDRLNTPPLPTFAPLKEDDRARKVKVQIDMGHAEFVTISDPFSSITRCEGMALSLIPLTSQMELDILGEQDCGRLYIC